MAWLKRLGVAAAFVYLVALLAVYVFQRGFIYFPTSTPVSAGFGDEYNVQLVGVKVADVGQITSIYRAPGPDASVILFFHGNGGSAHDRVAQLKDFSDWGVGFLAVEYPGYADNPGKPSEESFLNSALAHYDWLRDQGVNPDQIVIYGHSLGAASAVYVASKRDAAALVLTAPFLSALAMARRRMPFFPTKLLLKDKFRSDLYVESVDEPLVIFHGTEDAVVPHEMGKRLSDLYIGVPHFQSVDGAGHYLWGHRGMKDDFRAAVFTYAKISLP